MANQVTRICVFVIVDLEDSTDSLDSELDTLDNHPVQLKEIKLPKANTITATQVNVVSHTRRNMKIRERDLRKEENQPVRNALASVAEAGFMMTSTSIKAIDAAQAVRRSAREALQSFEQSVQQVRRRHTQQLRTKQAWQKLCAAERRYISSKIYILISLVLESLRSQE
jgi:hypothetical protein